MNVFNVINATKTRISAAFAFLLLRLFQDCNFDFNSFFRSLIAVFTIFTLLFSLLGHQSVMFLAWLQRGFIASGIDSLYYIALKQQRLTCYYDSHQRGSP